MAKAKGHPPGDAKMVRSGVRQHEKRLHPGKKPTKLKLGGKK